MTQVIDTLGKAARRGMIIRAECACGNLRYFTAKDLAILYGAGRDPNSLRFRCEKCEPSVKVTVLEVDADRIPRLVVWRPDPRVENGRRPIWRPRRLK